MYFGFQHLFDYVYETSLKSFKNGTRQNEKRSGSAGRIRTATICGSIGIGPHYICRSAIAIT